MKTIFAILTSLCVLGLVFIYYLLSCETTIIAIKCTMLMGTIASVLTFLLVKYGSD